MHTQWITPKEGAEYARENYRSFLKRLQNKDIRCVRRGRKLLTRYEWVDDYLFSLEDTGILQMK
jgi:hypothetical protein